MVNMLQDKHDVQILDLVLKKACLHLNNVESRWDKLIPIDQKGDLVSDFHNKDLTFEKHM